MTQPDLSALRNAAHDMLRDLNGPYSPVRWRVVTATGGHQTGITPVCPKAHNPTRPDWLTYDCCPRPVIEAGSEPLASYLVALLNADSGGLA
jgi:hypothetical protein